MGRLITQWTCIISQICNTSLRHSVSTTVTHDTLLDNVKHTTLNEDATSLTNKTSEQRKVKVTGHARHQQHYRPPPTTQLTWRSCQRQSCTACAALYNLRQDRAPSSEYFHRAVQLVYTHRYTLYTQRYWQWYNKHITHMSYPDRVTGVTHEAWSTRVTVLQLQDTFQLQQMTLPYFLC